MEYLHDRSSVDRSALLATEETMKSAEDMVRIFLFLLLTCLSI